MRDPCILPRSTRRSPLCGEGWPTRGVLPSLTLKFRANSGRISVRIKLADRQNRSFYAVPFVQIVALFALVGQVLPVKRDLRVLDVQLGQMNFVMDDIARSFTAGFAYTAVDGQPFSDVPGPAVLPGLTVVEFFSP